MKITVITGSRADYGLLEWPIKALKADAFFAVNVLNIWGESFERAFSIVSHNYPDMFLVLGDRFEILAAATAAHLKRIPIAHIGGGDVTEGSYDDAMRDAISRMASIHFVTSTSAMARLTHMGYRNVHLVGNPGIDYIRNAQWKKDRPHAEKYVVVSYQPETIDGVIEMNKVLALIPASHKPVFIYPNPDSGANVIRSIIRQYLSDNPRAVAHDCLPHDEFLNLIYHCDEFIGNSSSMLYEAPELGVKIRMIGKRQRGRVVPWGDGYASERIAKILKYSTL